MDIGKFSSGIEANSDQYSDWLDAIQTSKIDEKIERETKLSLIKNIASLIVILNNLGSTQCEAQLSVLNGVKIDNDDIKQYTDSVILIQRSMSNKSASAKSNLEDMNASPTKKGAPAENEIIGKGLKSSRVVSFITGIRDKIMSRSISPIQSTTVIEEFPLILTNPEKFNHLSDAEYLKAFNEIDYDLYREWIRSERFHLKFRENVKKSHKLYQCFLEESEHTTKYLIEVKTELRPEAGPSGD